MSQADDKDLVDRFAAMRRAERASAPMFANVRARAERQHSLRAPFALAAAAVAATIIGVLVGRDLLRRDESALLDLDAIHWTAPTDFLLNVPGNWMLRDLPEIASPASMQFDTTSFRRTSS